MARTTENYNVRLSVIGGRAVKAELNSVGREGEKSFKQITTAGKGATASMRDMTAFVTRRLVPAFAGLKLGRSIIEQVQTFELIDARLKRLTTSAEDYANVQDFLRTKSNELNIRIETLADSYSRLLALQDSGILNREEVNGLAEGFANLKAALGVDDSQIGNVLYGLSQALSQGTVQAQELNQVIEPVPGFLNEIAEVAGVKTAGAFREMVKEGKVSSDQFKEYVLEALKEYEGAAADITDTSVAALTRLQNSWTDLSRAIGEAGLVDLLSNFLSGLTIGVDAASTGIQDLVLWVAELDRQFRLFLTGFPILDRLASSPGGFSSISFEGDLPASHRGLSDFEDQLRATMNGLSDLNTQAAGVFRSGGLTIEGPPTPAKKPEKIYERAAKESEKASRDAQREYQREQKAIQDVIEALRFRNEQIIRSTEQQDLYNQLRSAGVDLYSAEGQEIQRLTDQYYELENALEADKNASEQLKKSARDLGLTFTSAFEDAIVAGDDFRDVLGGLLQDIQRILVRTAITEPLSGLFSDIGGDLFSNLFGGGGSASGVFNAFSSGLSGFATGGVTDRPAIFGEAGPEAAVPLPDGRTIPVTFTNPAGKQAGDTYYIDARGADREGLARLEGTIKQLNGTIEKRAVAAVGSEARRNPDYLRG